MIAHPDEHTFAVVNRRGQVVITCQMCPWHTSYPLGNEVLRKMAKEAAQQHNADQLMRGRRKGD